LKSLLISALELHLVDSPDAQQQVLDGTLNLTAVTWCRFAASLAAFAALAWLDSTFFGGFFRSPH
jgi:hypothetical protein